MKLFIVIVIKLLTIDLSLGFTYFFDMEKSTTCNTIAPTEIGLHDIVNIYAEPAMTIRGDRDRCSIKFTGRDGARFKIFVRDLIFDECEVYIKVYEGGSLNFAKHSFGCRNNAGGLYFTGSDRIEVSLEKPSPESNRYKFYIRIALEAAVSDLQIREAIHMIFLVTPAKAGPDIGGSVGGDSDLDTAAIGPGAIAGIIVAVVIGVGIGVAVLVYCIITWRKKEEEKEVARSMSTLFPPGKTETDHRDGSSVHSSSAHISWHSTKVPAENAAYNYPAYRTQLSISEKAPKCNSIDTKSYDSENTANESLETGKPKGKSARKELDSLRRTIFKIERDKEREKEEELRYLERERDRRHHDYGRHDEPLIDRRDRGLSSGRQSGNRPVLNAENIKSSLRSARDKGRSFGSDNNFNRSSRHGSGRSRSKHKARSHSPARSTASTRDSDYHSERHEHRSRRDRHDDKDRSRSGQRSSSAHSRRNKEYYDERDYHSDYESRDRHRSRQRYDDYSDDERYDQRSHRSGGHRARSGSSGRRRR